MYVDRWLKTPKVLLHATQLYSHTHLQSQITHVIAHKLKKLLTYVLPILFESNQMCVMK